MFAGCKERIKMTGVMTGVRVVPFTGVEKVVLKKLFCLKRSTAGVFAVLFRVLSRKIYDIQEMMC